MGVLTEGIPAAPSSYECRGRASAIRSTYERSSDVGGQHSNGSSVTVSVNPFHLTARS